MSNQYLLEQLKKVSELYGVYYLKLRVERRYHADFIEMRESPLSKEQVYLAMNSLLERHFNCEWEGEWWSMEFKTMMLEVYPMVENNFHFCYELIVALRSVVGDSSHITLPDVPVHNDMQYSYGEGDDLMFFDDWTNNTYHNAEWKRLDFEEVVEWYNKDREYLWGSRYHVRPGSWFSIFHMLDVPLNRKNQNIYMLARMIPSANTMYLYCNEKEWNKYRVIALWRLYIYYKKPIDLSVLWEDYRSVLDTIQNNENPDLVNYPDLYEKSVVYVSEAKELVQKDGRYLDLYKIV